jgi:protein-tyrosine-phosphatase
MPDISRRAFMLGTLVILAAGAKSATAGNATAPPTVLFVCQFGSVKSAIARELFKKMASERGVSVKVISRGITPEQHAAPALLERLRSEGIDPSADPLRQLDSAVLGSADVVVLFDPLPTSLVRQDARDWSRMPSMNSDYDQARRFLEPRMQALLQELRGGD